MWVVRVDWCNVVCAYIYVHACVSMHCMYVHVYGMIYMCFIHVVRVHLIYVQFCKYTTNCEHPLLYQCFVAITLTINSDQFSLFFG